jgi:hypothetical protein
MLSTASRNAAFLTRAYLVGASGLRDRDMLPGQLDAAFVDRENAHAPVTQPLLPTQPPATHLNQRASRGGSARGGTATFVPVRLGPNPFAGRQIKQKP